MTVSLSSSGRCRPRQSCLRSHFLRHISGCWGYTGHSYTGTLTRNSSCRLEGWDSRSHSCPTCPVLQCAGRTRPPLWSTTACAPWGGRRPRCTGCTPHRWTWRGRCRACEQRLRWNRIVVIRNIIYQLLVRYNSGVYQLSIDYCKIFILKSSTHLSVMHIVSAEGSENLRILIKYLNQLSQAYFYLVILQWDDPGILLKLQSLVPWLTSSEYHLELMKLFESFPHTVSML